MSSPSPNILAQLHDIHWPVALNQWIFAWGWYALGFVLLISLVVGGIGLYRYYQHRRIKQEALRLLKSYQDAYQRTPQHQIAAAQVSELLKRVALVYFPRMTVASLNGDAWWSFLVSTGKTSHDPAVKQALLILPYAPESDVDVQPLFYFAQQWIKQRRKPCSN